MSDALRTRTLRCSCDALTIVDPHTHINAALAGIGHARRYSRLPLLHRTRSLGGHAEGEHRRAGVGPEGKNAADHLGHIGPIENTIQYSWFIEIARKSSSASQDELVTPEELGAAVRRSALKKMNSKPIGPTHVLEAEQARSGVPDKRLRRSARRLRYPQCLRTVPADGRLWCSTWASPKCERGSTRRRKSSVGNGGATESRDRQVCSSISKSHASARPARSPLPPDFAPTKIEACERPRPRFAGGLERRRECCRSSVAASCRTLSSGTLAEYCVEFKLPFDLMIGVNRAVYPGGVFQGMDLYDSRVSLIQYKECLQRVPERSSSRFPCFASVTNQELDQLRLDLPERRHHERPLVVFEYADVHRVRPAPRGLKPCREPSTIGYYSDMYKLEFALPKFAMYKRILAKILAERYVVDRGWSEDRALQLGTEVLRDNTRRIFYAD